MTTTILNSESGSDDISENGKIDQFIMNQLFQELSHFPLSLELSAWQSHVDIENTLKILADEFKEYLNSVIEVTPEMIDQMEIPIELNPSYLGLNVRVYPVEELLAILNIPSCSRNYVVDRSGKCTTRDHGEFKIVTADTIEISSSNRRGFADMVIVFEWELLNRFLDQIPLGKIGAVSVFEIVTATPKAIKQLINWYRATEDRVSCYPLSTTVGNRISPLTTDSFRLAEMAMIVPQISKLFDPVDLIEVITSMKVKSVMRSFHSVYFCLNLVLKHGKFIKLLPDCQEQTVQFVTV